jgi:hypothetical protein
VPRITVTHPLALTTSRLSHENQRGTRRTTDPS